MIEHTYGRQLKNQKFAYAVIAILSAMVLLSSTLLPAKTSALTLDSPRDCDSNAVIYCGARSTKELKRKYNASPEAQAIYSHFGISNDEMSTIGQNAFRGEVTKDGQVIVDGKTVARNAVTVGRQNMAGSTEHTRGGTTFYSRPTSTSFHATSLPAFVVMKNGQFDHAIIASCGNPVNATPVRKQREQPAPQPAPAPQPPAPQPQAPVTPASTTVYVQQQQQQTQTQQPAPAPAPIATPVTPVVPVTPVATAPARELPKTGGLANIIGFTALAGTIAAAAHFVYSRRKLQN